MYRCVYSNVPGNLLRHTLMRRLHLYPETVSWNFCRCSLVKNANPLSFVGNCMVRPLKWNIDLLWHPADFSGHLNVYHFLLYFANWTSSQIKFCLLDVVSPTLSCIRLVLFFSLPHQVFCLVPDQTKLESFSIWQNKTCNWCRKEPPMSG